MLLDVIKHLIRLGIVLQEELGDIKEEHLESAVLNIFESQSVGGLANSEQVLNGGTLRIHQLGEGIIDLKHILDDPAPKALLINSHCGVGL